MENSVSGFSKFTKAEKIDWLISNHFQNNPKAKANLERYWNTDDSLQKLHDEFTENTISNFYLPFGVAPNFLINNKIHVLPMTIEESSVVAAASNAAKFWMERGGFTAEVLSTTKVGQVHFIYSGEFFELESIFNPISFFNEFNTCPYLGRSSLDTDPTSLKRLAINPFLPRYF